MGSNIQAPRGLSAPTLQASSKKDGGGNGDGGLYGQAQEEQQQQPQAAVANPFEANSVGIDDLLYSQPINEPTTSPALKAWKGALADALYKHVAENSDYPAE